MSIDKKLLAILVCPECNGKLKYDKTEQELHCYQCYLAYPIEDQRPNMLASQARKLTIDIDTP